MPESRTPRAVVCVPTYNERENIEPLVRALEGVLDVERDRVLVIDDASPDGTGEIADELAAQLPWLSVLHRERKEGIGVAYLAAFPVALATGAELVVQMDCDFSHDPKDVPRLVAACTDGADLALGSRWTADGRQVELGAIAAVHLPRWVVLSARRSRRRRPRPDRGFKCFRRRVLESLDLGAVGTRGYGFQIELTYRTLRAGFQVVELPITFVDRRGGSRR